MYTAKMYTAYRKYIYAKLPHVKIHTSTHTHTPLQIQIEPRGLPKKKNCAIIRKQQTKFCITYIL